MNLIIMRLNDRGIKPKRAETESNCEQHNAAKDFHSFFRSINQKNITDMYIDLMID